MFNFTHTLRISGRDDQTFLPPRKRDDAEIFVRKLLADVRQVEFSGSGVLEMRTRDVDLALLEPGERQLARGRSGDDLHAADPFHHSGKKTGGRVAPSQYEPFLSRFFLRKYNQVRA